MSAEDKKPDGAALAASIPGVRRGMPIEAVTDARAARLRIRTREEMSDVLVLDEAKFSDYLESKILAEDESRKAYWVPHFHPITGIVYTTRWTTPLSEIVDGKQRLIPGTGEVFKILKPTDVKVDLSALPISATSAKLIPQRLKSIESALRQQDEVAHDYFLSGPEFGRVEEISAAIRTLSIQFIQDHPRLDSDFEELRGQLAEFFATHGLERSTSRVWQSVQEKILKAAHKDSLGRPNPLVSRIRLGSALLGTATREVVVGQTREKSSRVYAHLFAEREVERNLLDWASSEMAKTQSDIREHIRMGPPEYLSDTQITLIREGFRDIDKILSLVRVSPYLESASLIRQFVASDQFRPRRGNDLINARLTAHHWEYNFESVEGTCAEEYLMRREPMNAVRVLETSRLLVEDCLSNPGNFDVSIFDK